MISHITNDQLLDKNEIVARLRSALELKTPYFLVRIGDGENFVLSQDSVYTMEQTLSQLWVKIANQGRKGVKIPNLEIRDRMVEAIREADIVGILAQNDRTIRAHPSHKRPLTDKIFNHFQLQPKAVCNAIVNQELIYHKPFWEMLAEQGSRVILISRWAGGTKQRLIRPPYNLTVPFTLTFERYEMMTDTLAKIESRKDDFDIALVSCGVNAVVLAHEIAKRTGKVAVDFGIGSQIISSVKI
ncbi:GT-D fold domain-containing glycosyltransferase [Paenibacillus sp. LHD-117]|uniref:GT-D fold domain-containing glycosyltransferase n=1 Tax=Paenibacillus sp. LHD-117 TaxID=3071412 RepID=UPI0027E082F6|nr:GT-D fold domain-containing glycosyltransferase [Paenibacillus sp. LHD-117]MDQ6418329.1 GT-D fold domain-containing glycosyltransferase [Paenibacillus sp. LHD-117]